MKRHALLLVLLAGLATACVLAAQQSRTTNVLDTANEQIVAVDDISVRLLRTHADGVQRAIEASGSGNTWTVIDPRFTDTSIFVFEYKAETFVGAGTGQGLTVLDAETSIQWTASMSPDGTALTTTLEFIGPVPPEFTYVTSLPRREDISVTVRHWPGDVNGDRIVGVADRAMIKATAGTDDTTCDLDMNGIVNSVDRAIVRYLGGTTY